MIEMFQKEIGRQAHAENMMKVQFRPRVVLNIVVAKTQMGVGCYYT